MKVVFGFLGKCFERDVVDEILGDCIGGYIEFFCVVDEVGVFGLVSRVLFLEVCWSKNYEILLLNYC